MKVMRTEQPLCWSGMTSDTEHSGTSVSNEEEKLFTDFNQN